MHPVISEQIARARSEELRQRAATRRLVMRAAPVPRSPRIRRRLGLLLERTGTRLADTGRRLGNREELPTAVGPGIPCP